MAHRLLLPSRPGGMPFMWNVSAHVGELASCPNRPTDVELVKQLLAMLRTFVTAKVPRAPGVAHAPMAINGQFDITLAYWIYSTQAHGGQGTVVDGIVSPAKAFGDPGTWLLCRWNQALFQANRMAWEALPQQPQLSAALRGELAKTA
jgi:hypothetical protein